MRYELVTFSEGLSICDHLFEEVWQEAGVLAGHKLNPNKDGYRAVDLIHGGFAIIAFDQDTAVGFTTIFMSLHNLTSELSATHDILYVRPEYRERGVSGRLILLAEKEAKKRGAKFFIWGAPKGSPLAQVFERRVPESNQAMQFIREL